MRQCETCGEPDRLKLYSCIAHGRPALWFCRDHYYEHERNVHGVEPRVVVPTTGGG